MKLTKLLVINTSSQLAGRLVSAGLYFVVILLLARAFSADLFGEYIKVVTVLTGMFVFVDFGLNPIYLHLVSEKKVNGYATLFVFRIFWSLSLYFFLLLLLLVGVHFNFLSYDSFFLFGIFVGGWSLVFGALTVSTTAAFQYHKKWHLVAISQVLGTLATLIGVWASVEFANHETSMYVGSIVSYLIGSLVTSFFSCMFFWRLGESNFNWKVNSSIAKLLLQRSLPLGLMMVVNGFYLRNGVLALSLARSSAEVGEYGLAYKFFEITLILPAFLMNSYYPDLLMKKTGIRNADLTKMLITLIKLSIVTATALLIGAPLLVFVRSEFARSVEILKTFSIIVPLFFLTAPLTWIYILKHQQKKLLYIYTFAFAFNLLITRILVSSYGSIGAVWAIGASETMVLLGGLMLYYQKYGKN